MKNKVDYNELTIEELEEIKTEKKQSGFLKRLMARTFVATGLSLLGIGCMFFAINLIPSIVMTSIAAISLGSAWVVKAQSIKDEQTAEDIATIIKSKPVEKYTQISMEEYMKRIDKSKRIATEYVDEYEDEDINDLSI